MTIPKHVIIREVGPREGFQTHSDVVPTEQKLELIKALNKTGVSEMEVVSFVRPDRVPQMADAVDVIDQMERRPGVQYHGLYLNQKGFEIAESTGRLDNRCWIYTATSDHFLKENSNATHQDLLNGIPAWIELFQKHRKELHGLMVSMAFGNASEGVFSEESLEQLVSRYVDAFQAAGAELKELSLADTVGFGIPEGVRSSVRCLRKRFPTLQISLHLHDTLGTGIANAYAGLLEGVSCFEASVGGMGGCPFAKGASGNIATEDLVSMLDSMGIETGIDLDAYKRAAALAEKIIGKPLAGHCYRVAS
jgi:hydroxymethylglutaryl-CoA lyase